MLALILQLVTWPITVPVLMVILMLELLYALSAHPSAKLAQLLALVHLVSLKTTEFFPTISVFVRPVFTRLFTPTELSVANPVMLNALDVPYYPTSVLIVMLAPIVS